MASGSHSPQGARRHHEGIWLSGGAGGSSSSMGASSPHAAQGPTFPSPSAEEVGSSPSVNHSSSSTSPAMPISINVTSHLNHPSQSKQQPRSGPNDLHAQPNPSAAGRLVPQSPVYGEPSTSPRSPTGVSDISNEAVNPHSLGSDGEGFQVGAAGYSTFAAAGAAAVGANSSQPGATHDRYAAMGSTSVAPGAVGLGVGRPSLSERPELGLQGPTEGRHDGVGGVGVVASPATASQPNTPVDASGNHRRTANSNSTTTLADSRPSLSSTGGTTMTTGSGQAATGVEGATSSSSSSIKLVHQPAGSVSMLANASGSNGLGIGEGADAGAAEDAYGGQAGPAPVIPTSFDEATLRTLCEMDCAMPLLYDRIKQSMISCSHFSTFLKKRALLEEEYARNMIKLAKATSDGYSNSEGKAGTFVNAFQTIMRTHEQLGDSRLRFAAKLNEMSEELLNLSKEVDKNRKSAKETGTRLERNLQDAEASVEKARTRFDATAEDLERLLLLKQGESTKTGELHGSSGGSGVSGLASGGKRTLGKAMGRTGLLFKNKNPQQILRQEEEIRTKTSNASDAFRKEVLSTQGMRQEYFNLQLPRILRSLKESSEEIDNGLQYHLTRYAFLYESTVLADGMSVSPVPPSDPPSGLKAAAEAIDNRADFKTFMQNYSVLHGKEYKGPRREGPYEEGFVPTTPGLLAAGGTGKGDGSGAAGGRPIFGVDLAEQMVRDQVEIPPILEKCAEAIEALGLESMGIYRLSGTTSKVQKLKAKFDRDWANVQLMDDEAIGDINIIAGCLKLWFRELPEPLMTHEGYAGFIEAAKIPNDRLRHIRIHERVNELPDCNYSTLRALMAHLDRVRQHEDVNQMSASNLAIVFGPTLLNPPPQEGGADGGAGGAGNTAALQDMSWQCKAVETILLRYREIFVDEDEA